MLYHIFLFLLLIFINVTIQVVQGADNDVFRVLSEGYKKNRESFTNVNCKFQLTRNANVENIQQAVKDELQHGTDTVIQDGVLLIKEGNVRFELKCRINVKKIAEDKLKNIFDTIKNHSNDTQRSIPMPCLDVFVMSSIDSYRLTYSNINETANIFPRGIQEGSYGIELSPFDMGIMARNEYLSPYKYLQDCISGKYLGQYEGTQEINGQQLEVVTFSTKESNNHPRMKFGFDPKKGFLATYIIAYDDKTHAPLYEAFILDVKHCSDNRFFPVKSVVIIYLDGKKYVNSFVVTELDVDTPLDLNLLRFEIPKGAQVSVPSFRDQWLTVEEPLSIIPQDIEQLQKKCIEYAKAYIKKHTTPPEFEPSLKRGNWWRVIFIVAGLILIGVGGGNLIRQWKMKK
jgi:hypothetical protein